MITHKAALEGLDELGLDEETTGLFLYENAKRIFKL
jgi:predicted TIM-barrel fold metal-dependent hydrolase